MMLLRLLIVKSSIFLPMKCYGCLFFLSEKCNLTFPFWESMVSYSYGLFLTLNHIYVRHIFTQGLVTI